MSRPPSLADRIDAILPQTQCTKCGYDGCRPYAEAIAAGEAAINRCPPGADASIAQLARLLDIAPMPLDRTRGTPGPLQVAVIDEAHCIGCTLCIQACPVDAIVGANKLMHTVIADLCTGCELCVDPCPVDCIVMTEAGHEWSPELARQARDNHQARQQRLHRLHSDDPAPAARTLSNKAPLSSAAHKPAHARQHLIADVLARARARRQES